MDRRRFERELSSRYLSLYIYKYLSLDCRLCEVMELNPVPILMSMVIFSNIGGTLTPVGDPPNVIIASNSRIQQAVSILFVLSKN
jgi:hypothetical protein